MYICVYMYICIYMYIYIHAADARAGAETYRWQLEWPFAWREVSALRFAVHAVMCLLTVPMPAPTATNVLPPCVCVCVCVHVYVCVCDCVSLSPFLCGSLPLSRPFSSLSLSLSIHLDLALALSLLLSLVGSLPLYLCPRCVRMTVTCDVRPGNGPGNGEQES